LFNNVAQVELIRKKVLRGYKKPSRANLGDIDLKSVIFLTKILPKIEFF